MNAIAAPAVSAYDRLGLTLFLAVALHGIVILGVSFQQEDKAELTPPPSLEIILVQNQSSNTPEKADYLAQIAQSGGGESEQRDRPSSPFTSSEPVDSESIAPQPLKASMPELRQAEPLPVITQLYAEQKILKTQLQEKSESSTELETEQFEYDLEIAKLTTELNLALEAYAKRPKKLVLTASTLEYIPAHYMHEWVKKVERVGNLNLPDETRRNHLEGSLLLEVEIKWDGSVVETNIIRPSGHKILDDTALRIVELASPFPAFPQDLRKIADHLEIVRTWQFQKGGLVTK